VVLVLQLPPCEAVPVLLLAVLPVQTLLLTGVGWGCAAGVVVGAGGVG
jgi:hypothetical protein